MGPEVEEKRKGGKVAISISGLLSGRHRREESDSDVVVQLPFLPREREKNPTESDNIVPDPTAIVSLSAFCVLLFGRRGSRIAIFRSTGEDIRHLLPSIVSR